MDDKFTPPDVGKPASAKPSLESLRLKDEIAVLEARLKNSEATNDKLEAKLTSVDSQAAQAQLKKTKLETFLMKAASLGVLLTCFYWVADFRRARFQTGLEMIGDAKSTVGGVLLLGKVTREWPFFGHPERKRQALQAIAATLVRNENRDKPDAAVRQLCLLTLGKVNELNFSFFGKEREQVLSSVRSILEAGNLQEELKQKIHRISGRQNNPAELYVPQNKKDSAVTAESRWTPTCGLRNAFGLGQGR